MPHHLLCFALQLFVAVRAGTESGAPANFVNVESGFIRLENTSSSSIFFETNSLSAAECAVRCRLRGCAAASLMKNGSICQLLVIYDASQTSALPETHVNRVMKQEAGALFWQVEDLEVFVQRRRFTNFERVLENTGIGRFGSVQNVSINATGCHLIEAIGAAGGNNVKVGGKGAMITGRFHFVEGTQLNVVVGQMGGNATSLYWVAGGGGGSFVYGASNRTLYVAAGGGGGPSSWRDGVGALNGTNGANSCCGLADEVNGLGGVNGQPGFNEPAATVSGSYHGGCGAGWLGKPINPRRSSNDGEEGGGLIEGWVGGRAGGDAIGCGGFGGGGGGGAILGAGGAGGGFSGGGAGVQYTLSGGGGNSFCGGVGCSGSSGRNRGHGRVVFRLLWFGNYC